jgi:hypothetical protein
MHAAVSRGTFSRLTEVRCGVFNAADWPAAMCDVIYSFQVIEHVSNLHEFVGALPGC